MGKETANLIFALILVGLSVFIAIESWSLGLDTLNNPGPGLFPLILGVILCVLAFASGAGSLKALTRGRLERKTEVSGDATGLRKACAVVISLTGYLILLNFLGFLIGTYLFLFALLSLDRPRNLVRIGLFAAAVDCLAYIIFKVLLQVPLPSGLLPIG